MKRYPVLFAVLLLGLAGQFAHAAYLDVSWYAQLSNVSVAVGSYNQQWNPSPNSTAHINVTGSSSYSDNGTLWSGGFSVPQSGQAPDRETASWGNMFLDPSHTFGSISFDYDTYWTQPNLVLQLTTRYLDIYHQDAVVWSSSLTGSQSGSVTINGNPNGYYFQLVAVPEPSGMLELGTLCSSCGLIGLYLRASRRRAR